MDIESPWAWWAKLLALFVSASMVQQATPEESLSSMLELARRGQVDGLEKLCDPQRQNDGDSDCICALSPRYQAHKCPANSHNRQSPEAFFSCFASVEITEAAEIEGQEAKVTMHANPKLCGFSQETMHLVQRGERWYLLGF